MKKINILQKYIFFELLKIFILSFLFLTLLFFLVVSLQIVRKYSQYLSFLDLIVLSPYILAKASSLTIPLSLLASTTFLYSRMVAEKEMLILRAAGIHAHYMVSPAILLSIILSFICFYLNANIAPYMQLKQRELKYKAIETILKVSFSSQETTISYIPNLIIYYKKLKNGKFHNLFIQYIQNNNIKCEILAQEGFIEYEKNKKLLTFYLFNGNLCYIKSKKKEERFFFKKFIFPISLKNLGKKKIRYNRVKYKTFSKLEKDLIKWKKILNSLKKKKKKLKKFNPVLEKKIEEAEEEYREHRLEYHKRIAISISPILVVFLGYSLGFIIRHRNKLVNFAASSIPILLIYYPLQIIGETLGDRGIIHPILGAWLGSIITGSIGIILLLYVYKK